MQGYYNLYQCTQYIYTFFIKQPAQGVLTTTDIIIPIYNMCTQIFTSMVPDKDVAGNFVLMFSVTT